MTDITFNSYTGTFQDVKNIWNEKLWPNRKSTIKEMSSMQYLDGFDMAIYEKYKPTFFIVKHQDKIVGVNSGHRTKDRLYRSRGIWVDPEFRRYGVAQILFDMTEKQAKKENCDAVWSMPRKSALPAYEKFLMERLTKLPGISSIKSSFALKEILHRTALPIKV